MKEANGLIELGELGEWEGGTVSETEGGQLCVSEAEQEFLGGSACSVGGKEQRRILRLWTRILLQSP